jgi:transcriptional regulator with XRE-family HTH domain
MPTRRVPPAIQEAIAANVRLHREKRGLTQLALAEAVGIEPRHVQFIEYARASPSLAILIALAEALGKTPADLLRPARRKPAARPGRPARRGR